jgi:large subunit ribosomal protein L10
MPTPDKIEKVEELSEKMTSAKAIYLTDYTGIDVASVSDLRNLLRGASVEYTVVKNRLAKRAAAASGIEGVDEFFTGPTALIFADGDPVEPAKILQEYADKSGKIAIKSGLLDGQIFNSEQVKQLTLLPSREELLGKVVGTVNAPLQGLHTVINGPLSGLANALSGVLQNLLGVVKAIEEKQKGADDA